MQLKGYLNHNGVERDLVVDLSVTHERWEASDEPSKMGMLGLRPGDGCGCGRFGRQRKNGSGLLHTRHGAGRRDVGRGDCKRNYRKGGQSSSMIWRK